jgi:assimilatory nitrate reductase catalytic subunit
MTRTTCPYCGVGCGVIAENGGVRGDPDHPANFGKLCVKGAALAETVGLEDRLLEPRIEGRAASWDEAVSKVAGEFSRVIAEHGPDAVAFYVSGQLLTEDYYVANKLAKGFLGTANIDTNSRLCMSSSVAGHKRAFGADVVPGNYEDLEEADLVVFVGSNAAWCHPVLYQRIAAAKAKRPSMRVVVVDPRRTDTCALADLHLALRPGSDAVLFNGLFTHLAANAVDKDFVARATHGLDAALAAASVDADKTAEICGLAPGSVALFFDWFAKTTKTVTLYSQGINQSTSGVDKVNAILNCHLLTGRIGRPGMGPFSLTGQPNAMGGREVGGLANQLAAHMDIENPAHREKLARFWNVPRVAHKPGLKAVDLFEALREGRVKALWIMATNPLVSLPDSDRAREALAACPFVVVSDCVASNDTLRYADVALPATGWGEKDGTVTNSERRISRQRRYLAAPGEARDDWRAVCDVGKAMGFHGFDFANAAAVFREHAALSGFENDNERAFDISGLADLTDAEFDALPPTLWPVRRGGQPTARLFGDGEFFTPDRRARFIPVTPRPPKSRTSRAHPLTLNTGRVRDHWHTLTRTGRSARLSAHVFEPYVEIHPEDAKRAQVQEGGLARLTSAQGQMIARVRLAPQQRRGCVFTPMHWSDENAAKGRVNGLVASNVDPISGQPESKQTPVTVEAFATEWVALALSRDRLPAPMVEYWVAGRARNGWRMELAGAEAPQDWEGFARRTLGAHGDWMNYRDRASGAHRFVQLVEGRLEACLYVARAEVTASHEWLAELFAKPALDPIDRMALLAGRPREARVDDGPLVCSCYSVGRNKILGVIAAGAATVAEVGARTSAGTNCGSCKAEIGNLIATRRTLSAAQPA